MRPIILAVSLLSLAGCAGNDPGPVVQVSRAVGVVGAAVLGVPGQIGGALGSAAGIAAVSVDPEAVQEAPVSDGGMEGESPAE